MLFLVAPILAQAINVSASGNIEGRAVFEDGTEYQTGANARAEVELDWRPFKFTLAYVPTLEATSLGEDPAVAVFHAGEIGAEYEERALTLGFEHEFGIGSMNFRTRLLAGGVAPTPEAPEQTPAPGEAAGDTDVLAENAIIDYGTTNTTARLLYRFQEISRLNFEAGYSVSGALDAESAVNYPLVRVGRGLVELTHQVTRRDTLTSFVTAQYSTTSTNRNSLLGTVGASYERRFDRSTSGVIGAGLSGSREPDPEGRFTRYDFFPNFRAALSSDVALRRGRARFGADVTSGPVIDLTTAVIDPRVTVGVGAGYERDRSSATVSLVATQSNSTSGDPIRLRNITGTLGFAYRAADFLELNTGVRSVYQLFEGEEVVPLTFVAYLGARLNLEARLVR